MLWCKSQNFRFDYKKMYTCDKLKFEFEVENKQVDKN